MPQVQQHYEHLLAEHYTWMFGVPFADKVTEQADLLRRAGVNAPHIAVDLGCGPGFQSLALCRLGAARVFAVDTSRRLLDELETHKGDAPVTPVEGDLRDFRALVPEGADTVVCMGDTLTHLPDKAAVSALFAEIAATLPPGGRCVVSYRDLSAAPAGLDRFIPLRATADKIMTCFLERTGAETVTVHDLVHLRAGETWTLLKSAYPKLILPLAELRRELAACGLMPDFEDTARGMITLGLRRA